jgi:hypothetical protein
MRVKVVALLAVVLVSSLIVVAEDSPSSSSNLPKLLTLNREDIKPGKMAEHDALMRQVLATASGSKADWHFIAGRSVTGNTSEFVAVGFANSYADVEKNMQALQQTIKQASMQNPDMERESVESHQSMRQVIARLREDLCYRPEQVDVAQARYWEISVLKFKPGTLSDFAELEKEGIELHKKGNIDERWAAYEVEYGSSGPAIIFLTPLRSLADLDADLEKAHDAVFTASIRRRFQTTSRDSMVSAESTLIAIRPEISRPSDTIVAANPDFWTVKEAVAEAPPAKGKGKKKAALQPAVLKESETKK